MRQTTPLDNPEIVKEEVIVTRAAIDRAVAAARVDSTAGTTVEIPRNLWEAIVMARYSP